MSVMYIRNEQTGEFEPVPSLVGPQGPPGSNGDGAGTVTSVNKVAPDANGNVTLTAADVGALPSDGTAVNANALNGKSADQYALKTDIPEDTGGDADTLGGKEPKYYIQPRNLLDNSDFRNPVNQRGQTDYTSNGYTIDRWELYDGAVGVTSLGYITTSGQMYQKIDIPTDKVYTFAVENDAGIAVVTGIPANGIHSATLGNALIKLATIGEYVEVVIEPSEGYDIAGAYCAALYEGEYTADNLPPYVPKGYGVELAECQRYYLKSVGRGAAAIYISTNNMVSINISIPVKMRATPTATVSNSGNIVAKDWVAGINSVSSVELYDNIIRVVCETSSSAGNWVTGVSYDISFDLSADL